MYSTKDYLFSLLFLATLLSQQASAGLILSPVSATATSTNFLNVDSSGISLYDIQYAINQGGLLSSFDSGITDFDTYLSTNPLHDYLPESQEWFGARKGISVVGGIVRYPTDTLTFDLGMNYDIDRFALWNEENGGIRHSVVSTSDDGINFTQALSITPSGNPFDPNASYEPSKYNYGADVFQFSNIVNARYIQLNLTCPNNNSIYAGCSLGEIAFSVASVPEPSIIALMATGLLGAGFARKRQRVKLQA
ncbi:MAG: discoidin domain-containing protein [Gammaproteobacteria bacterium]|nr:discoidin domain-containing protein [Gammaproteobacteria bacterium]